MAVSHSKMEVGFGISSRHNCVAYFGRSNRGERSWLKVLPPVSPWSVCFRLFFVVVCTRDCEGFFLIISHAQKYWRETHLLDPLAMRGTTTAMGDKTTGSTMTARASTVTGGTTTANGNGQQSNRRHDDAAKRRQRVTRRHNMTMATGSTTTARAATDGSMTATGDTTRRHDEGVTHGELLQLDILF